MKLKQEPPQPMPPFRYYMRVRYHECDMQRVVFNGHYGTFIDMACTEFMKALLPDRHAMQDGKFEFQLVRQVIEWKAPARFDDIIEIGVYCPRIGTTSFDLAYELRKPHEAEPFATALTVSVSVDGTTWTKQPVPTDIRLALEQGLPGVVVDHAGYLAQDS